MDYFLSFDYWTETKNKFWNGIVNVDLRDTSLQQVCRDAIANMNHDEHKDTWAVKVLSFNNVNINQ